MTVATRGKLIEIQAVPGEATDRMLALQRSARSPVLHEVATDPVGAFAETSFAIVGCGSVGMNHADRAARLGPRSILCVDPADLKAESTLTHPCMPADVGRPKAIVGAERAKAVSPSTRVFAFVGGLEDVPIHVLSGVTHMLLGSDNLRAETLAGERALQLGFQLQQGSVHAGTLTAQSRVFPASKDAAGSCPACQFSAREWRDLDEGVVYSCGGAEPAGTVAHARRATASLPHLCSVAADLNLNELTRSLVGLDAGEGSRLVEFCGFTRRTTVTGLVANPECPFEHVPTRLVPAEDLAERTVESLVAEAGYSGADPHRVTLTVEAHRFAILAACGCTRHAELFRFLPDDAHAGGCEACGEPRFAHPLHVHRETPVAAFRGVADRSLASLGATPTAIRVRGDHGPVLVHAPSPWHLPAEGGTPR